jgi:hypothetical protein
MAAAWAGELLGELPGVIVGDQSTNLMGVFPMPRLPRGGRWWRLEIPWEAAKDHVVRWWEFRMAEPKRRRNTWIACGVAGVLLLTGVGAVVMPRFQPDYETDPLDEVFDYTLLSDEFNKLSVEERLKLIGQLVQRLKGMSSQDSVLLAAFASGIAGAARQQIEENVSRLAIDAWDKYAKDYDSVPPEGREQFLEQTFIEMTKLMEAVAGEQRDISDAERINDAREDAQRNRQWLRDNPGRGPDGEALGRVFAVVNGNVGGNANPQQRVRGQLMMRDMVRHFRNQDVATGKPLGPG